MTAVLQYAARARHGIVAAWLVRASLAVAAISALLPTFWYYGLIYVLDPVVKRGDRPVSSFTYIAMGLPEAALAAIGFFGLSLAAAGYALAGARPRLAILAALLNAASLLLSLAQSVAG